METAKNRKGEKCMQVQLVRRSAIPSYQRLLNERYIPRADGLVCASTRERGEARRVMGDGLGRCARLGCHPSGVATAAAEENNRAADRPGVAVTYLVWLLTTDLQNPLSSSRKYAMG